MPKSKKQWVYVPVPDPKAKVPENLKTSVELRFNELIQTTLKPQHVKPPKDTEFNYIVDIYARWTRNYFYLIAKYHCPSPNAIAPFFESKFARLEYAGNQLFNLAYMRHTGQWWPLYSDVTLDQCVRIVREDPNFMVL